MSQSKISTYRRNRIFACFCQDVTATAAAKLAGVNRNTANYYYGKIRALMLQASLLEGGRVFVKVVENCSREELLPIIQGKILEKSVIYTDGWKGYDGLIVNGYDHYRVFHSHDEFVRGKSHVNGIENFWSFAKRRLAKFNGCASDKFVLHLKECEFRYNHRDEDLLPVVKKLFKNSEKC